MKPLNIRQVETLLKSEPFKYVSLVDAEGSTIVAYNTPRIKVEQRKKEILAQLRSSLIADGLYYLLYKEQLENNNVKRYPVAKGNVNLSEVDTSLKNSEVKQVEKIVMREENVLTWASALEMQKRITELEIECEKLKIENQQLNDELDEIDEDESAGGLNEGGSQFGEKFFEGLMEKATPLVDKYFDIREREVTSLQEMAAKGVAPPAIYRPTTPKTSTVPTPPATQPTTQTYIAPGATAPPSGGVPTPPGELDTTEMENQLMSLPLNDLKDIYEGLKRAGNFTDLKIFLRILKAGRPDELAQIVKADL